MTFERPDPGDAPTMRQLVATTLPVGIAMALSILLRLCATVLSTRVATVEAFGVFATINAICALLGTVVMGGWPSYLLAVVPKYGLGRNLLRSMNARLGATTIAFVGAQSAFILVAIEFPDRPLILVTFAGMLLAGTSFATTYNEAERATGSVVLSRFSLAIVPPCTTMAILLPAAVLNHDVSATLLLGSNAAGWVALWLGVAVLLRRSITPHVTVPVHVSRRDLMIAKISQAGLSSGDVIAVGWLLGPKQGALYAVASRLAVSSGIAYTAVVMAFGPTLSRVSSDPGSLRTLTKRMTALGVVLTIPIAACISLLSEQLLRLFGNEYAEAQAVMLILLAGVSINAISGPVGLLANVTHQEHLSRRTLLTSCLAFFLALPPVTVLTGTVGAAVLWSLVTAAWNVALWLQLQRE